MKKGAFVGLLLVAVILAYFFAMKKANRETPLALTEAAMKTVSVFGPEDLVVNDVRFGESPEDVEKKLGKPKSKGREEMIPATGGEYYVVAYDGLELRFFLEEENKRSLRFAAISGPGYTGPRGLRVGDAKEAVIAAFPSPRNLKSPLPDVDLLYASGVSGDNVLPPMGTIETDEDSGEEIVSYVCPTPPYEEQSEPMDIQNIYLDYVYLEHAIAWFEIEDGRVSQIHLSQGALAE